MFRSLIEGDDRIEHVGIVSILEFERSNMSSKYKLFYVILLNETNSDISEGRPTPVVQYLKRSPDTRRTISQKFARHPSYTRKKKYYDLLW